MDKIAFLSMFVFLFLSGCEAKKNSVSVLDSIIDQSVLTVLGDGCGFVTKDDCSYHEKKESSAYRVQCSATHLHWYPDSSAFASMNFLGGERKRDSVYSRVVSIEDETIEKNLTKVCFIESVPPSFDCPPCVAALGAMLWTMENDKNRYKLSSVNLNIASIGQNGLIASAPEKLALKKDRNGYVFTHTVFFQGISETEITVMGIVGSEFRTLLKVITESDNEGACSDPIGCWGYTSTVITKENEELPLDDIVVTTAGTRMTEDGKDEFEIVYVYRFNGDGYSLISSRG